MIEDQVVAILIVIKVTILIVLVLFPFCAISVIVSWLFGSRWCVVKLRWLALNNDDCGFQLSPIPWFNMWSSSALKKRGWRKALASYHTVTISYGWLIWELQFWFNSGPDLI